MVTMVIMGIVVMAAGMAEIVVVAVTEVVIVVLAVVVAVEIAGLQAAVVEIVVLAVAAAEDANHLDVAFGESSIRWTVKKRKNIIRK
jgi:hypothetical protein